MSWDLGAGTASYELAGIHLKDFISIPIAFGFVDGPPPAPAALSFRVEWDVAGSPLAFDNPDQQWRGSMRVSTDPNAARMWWKARIGELDYESAPLTSSHSSYAQLGEELNGSYY